MANLSSKESGEKLKMEDQILAGQGQSEGRANRLLFNRQIFQTLHIPSRWTLPLFHSLLYIMSQLKERMAPVAYQVVISHHVRTLKALTTCF